jgi:hypothetical protein
MPKLKQRLVLGVLEGFLDCLPTDWEDFSSTDSARSTMAVKDR